MLLASAGSKELAGAGEGKGRKGGREGGQSEYFCDGNFIGKCTKKVRNASHWVANTSSKAIKRKSMST